MIEWKRLYAKPAGSLPVAWSRNGVWEPSRCLSFCS